MKPMALQMQSSTALEGTTSSTLRLPSRISEDTYCSLKTVCTTQASEPDIPSSQSLK